MEKIKFDYSKLKGRITEKCSTQKAFAELLGITEGTLTSKLQGYTYFTQDEILKAVGLLDIEPNCVDGYFFTVAVGKT
jgi:transcriptional regulator with XRE-family HTH domain